MRNTPLRAFLTPLWGVLASACTFALDVSDDQCESDRDCAERGAPSELRTCRGGVCRAATGPAAFACLRQVRGAIASKPEEALQRVFVHDLNSSPLADVAVQLCATGDFLCAQPLQERVTDNNGRVEFRVDTDFNVYFQYQAAGAMPGLLHTTPAYRREANALIVGPLERGTTDYDAFGLSFEVASTLASAARATLSPERGFAFVRVLGCEPGVQSAGVVVEIEAAPDDTRVFYDRGGAPVAAETTDASGSAYVLNLPVGLVTVRAKVKATGEFLGERTVISRAGVLTTFSLGPSP
jgi:hypothetical protein